MVQCVNALTAGGFATSLQGKALQESTDSNPTKFSLSGGSWN